MKKEMAQKFCDIYKNNSWGSRESVSGKGSEVAASQGAITGLVSLIDKHGIQRIFDVPCGDFNWMREVFYKCEPIVAYFGVDIVPDMIDKLNEQHKTNQMINFLCNDITDDEMVIDIKNGNNTLIVCRDLLIHLPLSDSLNVVNKVMKSGAKYVAITHQEYESVNREIPVGSYAPRNLYCEPFNLNKPYFQIKETLVKGFPQKYLNVYKLYS